MRTPMPKNILYTAIALLLLNAPTPAAGKPPVEEDYYKILRFQTPPGQVLEAGALEVLPDGRLAVGTRRGEIWLVENATAADPKEARFTRFAHGLHEVLGLAWPERW